MNLSGTGGTGSALSSQAKLKNEEQGYAVKQLEVAP